MASREPPGVNPAARPGVALRSVASSDVIVDVAAALLLHGADLLPQIGPGEMTAAQPA